MGLKFDIKGFHSIDLQGKFILRFIPVKFQKPKSSVRLYCFPYAGGSAQVFSPWHALISDSIEVVGVQYPGRSERFNEPAIDDCILMAKAIAADINAADSKPFALLGYSMGGAIAYETMRHLKKPPAALFLCASQPPKLSKRRRCEQNEEQLIEDIKKLGGIDERLLEDNEMRALIINMMRTDFKLLDTYQSKTQHANCPVHIIYGTKDPHVAPESAKEWQKLCVGQVHYHEINGEHFFIRTHRDELINCVQRNIMLTKHQKAFEAV